MKITMHYNGDGEYEMQFRGVTRCAPEDGNYVFLSQRQMDRLQRARRGSGLDGTVGYTTYTVEGKTVTPVVA